MKMLHNMNKQYLVPGIEEVIEQDTATISEP